MSTPIRCVTCGQISYAKKNRILEIIYEAIDNDKSLSDKKKESRKFKALKEIYPKLCCRGRNDKYFDRANIDPAQIKYE